ncbi:MAG: hypothetical protein P4L22_04390 [Candidatus Babeliales bacterium]|nr:hypothetical protein [Candidatus Babeliales bacterium]
MKKIILLVLFSIANMSFNSQAVSWKSEYNWRIATAFFATNLVSGTYGSAKDFYNVMLKNKPSNLDFEEIRKKYGKKTYAAVALASASLHAFICWKLCKWTYSKSNLSGLVVEGFKLP